MNPALAKKKAIIADVAEHLESAQSAVIAEYRGLSVSQLTELRKNAYETGVYLKVMKNTLARIAVKNTDFECLTEQLVGPLVIAVSEDPVAAAKVMSDFSKENADLVIKAGAMNAALMNEAEIAALAKLPGREELLGMLAGTLQAPIAKFARTLNEVPTKAARALAAVLDQKEAA